MKTFAVLFLTLLAAWPLEAQTILPQAKPATSDRDGVNTGDSFRKVMDEYAACMLGRRRRPVLEVLAMPSGSKEQGEALMHLPKTDCLDSGWMRFDIATYRGSFYTALVVQKFSRKPPSFGPGPADFTRDPPPGGGGVPIEGVAQLLNFASCVVHKDPQNAHDAIVATAGSPKEDAALAGLSKVYGSCLFADQTLRLSKDGLLGALAEAYYREGISAAN